MTLVWRGRTFKNEEERDKFAFRHREALIADESAGNIYGQCIIWAIVALVLGVALQSFRLFFLVIILGIVISIVIAENHRHEILACAARYQRKLQEERAARVKELRKLAREL